MRPERLLYACLRFASKVRARMRGERRPPLRIAGLMPVRDYSDATSAFAALRRLSDVTIVLDDNSALPFPYRGECDEYLRLENRQPWNDTANRTLLLYRAFVRGCDWALFMDDDLVFSHDFQTRDDAAALIAELEAAGKELCRFPLRDLWDSAERYRRDGIWSRKSFAVLRRNWFAYPGISLRDPGLRLHAAVFPANLYVRQTLADPQVVYHTGCLRADDRRERVERYRREDPEHRFQADYSYMLDDRGLQLADVPPADLTVIRAAMRLGEEET